MHTLTDSRRARTAIVFAAVAIIWLCAGFALTPKSSRAHASVRPSQCVTLSISTNYQWRTNWANADADLPRLYAMGVREVREDIFWSNVQPDSPSQWNWSLYDDLFVRLSRYRMRVLPIIGYGTTWASAPKTAHDMPSTRSGQAAYARFAQAVVARYGPAGFFWKLNPSIMHPSRIWSVELWNEPWYAPNPSVNDYVALLRAAGNAIHHIAPRVLVAANVDYRWYDSPESPARFWGQAVLRFAPELKRAINRWAMHPYPWPTTGRNTVNDAVSQVHWLQHQLNIRGIHSFIWVTEIGFNAQGGSTARQYVQFLHAMAQTSGWNRVTLTSIFTAARPTADTHPGSWDYGYNLISARGKPTSGLTAAVRSHCA